MGETIIRKVKLEDSARVREIYKYYVENTAITFEYDVPTLAEMQNRIRTTVKKYPYLVAEKNGQICGYAYAGPFIRRAAYDWSCETSIYIDHGVRKEGLGRKLYEALEEELKEMGILNLYACIGYPAVPDEYLDRNSAEFHAHMGYQKVGEFHQCGYKFGRWYNMIWMEKRIGIHRSEIKVKEGGIIK